MASTGYLESEVPASRLARGYVWRDGTFLEEPMDGYGALASMGGIFTTVRDLSIWVRGFIDAFPPRDAPGRAEAWSAGHPLGRASRREMQQPMVAFEPELVQAAPDAEPQIEGGAYGFGLFVEPHARWGRLVGHSGGYPGFGSNMRWHPSSGLGVIVLANGRYAPAAVLGRELIVALLEAEAAPTRRVVATPATLDARAAIERLIEAWDEDLADRVFAMNVDLDEPLARRRATLEGLRSIHGPLRPDPDEATVSRSPFNLEWWLRGERGRVKLEILLDPELPPRVQALTVTSVPEPPAELTRIAELIAARLAAGETSWPADLELEAPLDGAALGRSMRATEARFGPVRLGPVVAGDGRQSATFRLDGERGRLELVLDRDPLTGRLRTVALRPVPLSPPDLA